MEPQFRIDLQEYLASDQPIVLELGCGKKKRPDRLCIDRLDMPNVDIVANLEQGLPFFPDNSVDAIYSKSLLEHIDNLDALMREIWRVLKPNGKKHVYVPHFSNPYYYSDYTHQRFFGLYSFEYFSTTQDRFKRNVPDFYGDYGFITEDVQLVFGSAWKSRRLFKRSFGKMVNLCRAFQEYYEENLCYIIPCYAIRATLRPDKST